MQYFTPLFLGAGEQLHELDLHTHGHNHEDLLSLSTLRVGWKGIHIKLMDAWVILTHSVSCYVFPLWKCMTRQFCTWGFICFTHKSVINVHVEFTLTRMSQITWGLYKTIYIAKETSSAILNIIIQRSVLLILMGLILGLPQLWSGMMLLASPDGGAEGWATGSFTSANMSCINVLLTC